MREKLDRKSCSASDAALEAALLTEPKPRVLARPIVAFPGETSPPPNDDDEGEDGDDAASPLLTPIPPLPSRRKMKAAPSPLLAPPLKPEKDVMGSPLGAPVH
jgi:hypothetical protein